MKAPDQVCRQPDFFTPVLQSGQWETGVSAPTGGWKYYKITGEPSAQLKVELESWYPCAPPCNPDLDLYVRQASSPVLGTYSCKSVSADSTEACTLANPPVDVWYIGVYTYAGTMNTSFDIRATFS